MTENDKYTNISNSVDTRGVASGLSCSYNNLRRIRFWEVEVDFPSHGSQLSLALLLSKSVEHGR